MKMNYGFEVGLSLIPNQGRHLMFEDCLYLNIWRPNNEEKDLPILVFIHGGSLTTGSSSFEDYNGEEMAKKGE